MSTRIWITEAVNKFSIRTEEDVVDFYWEDKDIEPLKELLESLGHVVEYDDTWEHFLDKLERQ